VSAVLIERNYGKRQPTNLTAELTTQSRSHLRGHPNKLLTDRGLCTCWEGTDYQHACSKSSARTSSADDGSPFFQMSLYVDASLSFFSACSRAGRI